MFKCVLYIRLDFSTNNSADLRYSFFAQVISIYNPSCLAHLIGYGIFVIADTYLMV